MICPTFADEKDAENLERCPKLALLAECQNKAPRLIEGLCGK
jgi:hypothetical protein